MNYQNQRRLFDVKNMNVALSYTQTHTSASGN